MDRIGGLKKKKKKKEKLKTRYLKKNTIWLVASRLIPMVLQYGSSQFQSPGLDTFSGVSEPIGFSGSVLYGNVVAYFGISWLVNLASYQPHRQCVFGPSDYGFSRGHLSYW